MMVGSKGINECKAVHSILKLWGRIQHPMEFQFDLIIKYYMLHELCVENKDQAVLMALSHNTKQAERVQA